MENSSLLFSPCHQELLFREMKDFLLVILTNNKQNINHFILVPMILTFLGRKIEATLITPATSAAPHLSRDIPAMIPKIAKKLQFFKML